MAVLAAREPGERVSVGEVATVLGVSAAHLSKVLQRLAQLGYLESRRGPGGGFVLGMAPSEVTLLEIYEAIDGPIRRRACLLKRQICQPGECILGDLVSDIQHNVREHLANTRLSDFLGRRFGRAPEGGAG